MFLILLQKPFSSISGFVLRAIFAGCLIALTLMGPLGRAQNQQPPPSQEPTATPTPAKNPNSPPEAGGPAGDIGPIAIPKKKEEPPRKEDVPRPPKKEPGMPDYSLRVNVPLVTI